MIYFVGIDPGKEGAIAILSEDKKVVQAAVIPCIGNQLDLHGLRKYVFDIWDRYRENVAVCVEDIHAIFGSAAGATFTFGGVFYAIQQCLVDHAVEYTLVQPKVWQKMAYQGIPEIRKAPIQIKKGKRAGQTMPGKLDCKKMSLIAAQRLFPKTDMRKSDKCSIAHDGIVDALLIAEYCRRTKK